MFGHEIVPSARQLSHLEDEVMKRLGRLPPTIFEVTLDVLGDMGLTLATIPMARWAQTRDGFARCVGEHFSWPEATAAADIAIDKGLLVPTSGAPEGTFHPAEAGLFLWLAARRIAKTDDQDGLLDHRLRGPLMDVFAMAAAMVEDDATSVGLVHTFLTKEGPLEDLLHLGTELAMLAVAWGARTDEETHLQLVRTAFDWTSVSSNGDHVESATALLAAEAWSGPLVEEVRLTARERLETALEEMNADEELLHHPKAAEAVDADLVVLVSGSGGDADLLVPWFDQLGTVHSFRVGKAIARALPPSEAKNAFIVWAANQAMKRQDVDALSTMGALSEPIANSVGTVHTIFKLLLEHPDDDELVATAHGALRAIAHWKSCPELTIHLVSRLALSPIAAQVRIAAAGVLARHPKHVGESYNLLTEAFEAALDAEEAVHRAAGAGGLLFLGSDEPRAAAMAIGLVVDGVPSALFGEAFASGLRTSPAQAEGLEGLWQHFADRADIHSASIELLGALAETCQVESGVGPYFTGAPLDAATRRRVLAYLLDRIHDFSDPSTALSAAVHAAWIARGDEALGLVLRSLKLQVDDPEQRELVTMAIGALGHRVDVIPLVEEAAHGTPDESAAAARAAMVCIETRPDTDGLDELVPLLERRARQEGPQQEPVRALLRHMAVVSLADAPL